MKMKLRPQGMRTEMSKTGEFAADKRTAKEWVQTVLCLVGPTAYLAILR
jgi:hypothetical protein